MFNSLEQFKNECIKANEFFNSQKEFESEFLQNKDELFSEGGCCFKLSILKKLNSKNIIIEIFLHYKNDSKWITSYFVIKDFNTMNILNIEEFKENFNNELFKKVELDLNRVDFCSNFFFSKNMVYKLNDCGLKEKYILLKSTESNKFFTINKIIEWLSWICYFFNIYFKINYIN